MRSAATPPLQARYAYRSLLWAPSSRCLYCSQATVQDDLRRSFEEVAGQLDIKQLADWYGVTKATVIKKGGERIFANHSLLERALKAAYPEFPWEPLRFRGSARGAGYWQQRRNILAALDRAERRLFIEQPEDWYSVTLADLKDVDNFPRELNRTKLAEYLQNKYPDYAWDLGRLLPSRKVQQKKLEKAVKTLFQGQEMILDARREANLVNPATGNYLELDIYLPQLRLAFEFQEKHHYISADNVHSSLEEIMQRDVTKRNLAKRNGIALITVPCWWDGTLESLAATLREARPDIDLGVEVPVGGSPIPKEMPHDFIEKNTVNIEGIGAPTNARFFTLSSIDPKNWWLFEKYDGVRAFWNPEKQTFYSRHGNVLKLPDKIIQAMPSDIFLDGELWFGPDSFQEVMKVVNKVDEEHIDWSKFKYMVFDVPTHHGTYAERYSHLVESMRGRPKNGFVEVAPMELCSDTAHLERVFQDVMDRGGEGVILRDPIAPYQAGGRSPGYLKHKKYRDCEAKVVGPTKFGLWECELPDGIRFEASPGTSEFVKRWHLQPGDIVSFKHRGFLAATKKPKLPTLHRVRTDLTWEHVVNNWKEQKSTSRSSPPTVLRRKRRIEALPRKYWRDLDARRGFFIRFAQEKGFNPLVAENWFKVTGAEVAAHKGRGLLAFFNGSLKTALQETFPEIFLTRAWPISKR